LPGTAKECQCQEATGALRSRLGRVNLFLMGSFGSEELTSPGNYWVSLDDFPTFTATTFYLGAGEVLSAKTVNASGSVTYTYDPSNPPPMVGGCNLPAIGTIKYAGSADQRSRENRSDVILFDSPALTEDTAVVGAISASIFVSSSAADTDFSWP